MRVAALWSLALPLLAVLAIIDDDVEPSRNRFNNQKTNTWHRPQFGTNSKYDQGRSELVGVEPSRNRFNNQKTNTWHRPQFGTNSKYDHGRSELDAPWEISREAEDVSRGGPKDGCRFRLCRGVEDVDAARAKFDDDCKRCADQCAEYRGRELYACRMDYCPSCKLGRAEDFARGLEDASRGGPKDGCRFRLCRGEEDLDAARAKFDNNCLACVDQCTDHTTGVIVESCAEDYCPSCKLEETARELGVFDPDLGEGGRLEEDASLGRSPLVIGAIVVTLIVVAVAVWKVVTGKSRTTENRGGSFMVV